MAKNPKSTRTSNDDSNQDARRSHRRATPSTTPPSGGKSRQVNDRIGTPRQTPTNNSSNPNRGAAPSAAPNNAALGKSSNATRGGFIPSPKAAPILPIVADYIERDDYLWYHRSRAAMPNAVDMPVANRFARMKPSDQQTFISRSRANNNDVAKTAELTFGDVYAEEVSEEEIDYIRKKGKEFNVAHSSRIRKPTIEVVDIDPYGFGELAVSIASEVADALNFTKLDLAFKTFELIFAQNDAMQAASQKGELYRNFLLGRDLLATILSLHYVGILPAFFVSHIDPKKNLYHQNSWWTALGMVYDPAESEAFGFENTFYKYNIDDNMNLEEWLEKWRNEMAAVDLWARYSEDYSKRISMDITVDLLNDLLSYGEPLDLTAFTSLWNNLQYDGTLNISALHKIMNQIKSFGIMYQLPQEGVNLPSPILESVLDRSITPWQIDQTAPISNPQPSKYLWKLYAETGLTSPGPFMDAIILDSSDTVDVWMDLNENPYLNDAAKEGIIQVYPNSTMATASLLVLNTIVYGSWNFSRQTELVIEQLVNDHAYQFRPQEEEVIRHALENYRVDPVIIDSIITKIRHYINSL